MKLHPITQYEQYKRLSPESYKFVQNLLSYDDTDFDYVSLARFYMWSNGLKYNQNTALYQYLYHFHQMLRHGEKIFYITKNMAQMFNCTSVNVHADLVQSPFQEVFLHFEDSGIEVSDMEGRKGPLKGVYVNLRNDSEGRTLRIMAVSDLLNDINTWSKIPLHESKSDDALENHLAKAFEDLPFTAYRDTYKEMIQKVYRLVINTLLYITSKSSDMKKIIPVLPTSKKPKIQKRMSKSASIPYIIVGSNTPKMHGAKEGKSYQITERFMVRGHWRAQWRGSRKNNSWHQETIWIKPYIKGDDLGQIINKKYKV